MHTTSFHTSVLLHETVDCLNLQKDAVVIDGTLGGGGHTQYIAQTLQKLGGGTIIGIDLDEAAEARAHKKIEEFINPTSQSNSLVTFKYVNGNFRDMKQHVEALGIKSVDGIVLDLGLSSFQLEVSGRGFTFQKDEPLEMTFGEKGTSAAHQANAKEIVNTWSEETLANIIYGYGEDTKARKIARAIAEARKVAPLETSGDLVKVIESAVGIIPKWLRKTHPATKTFQALRIAVNDELGALRQGLIEGFELLKVGGRMSVISFHSIEDRIVKEQFRSWSKEMDGTRAHDSESAENIIRGTLINKKPITPSDDELMINPRARSAKLRVIEKIV